MENKPLRPVVAGKRPIVRRFRPDHSDFSLFGDLQGVVYLDAKVPHRAFELRMTEQQLHGSQVSGSPVDQCWLGAPD